MRATSLGLALFVWASAAPARADEGGPPVDVGPRLLWGAGAHLGGSVDTLTTVSPFGLCSLGCDPNPTAITGAGGGIGLYLRMGEQLNDRWGIEAEVSGGTLIVANYIRAALTVDYTPADWFTFAIGPAGRGDGESQSNGQGNGQSGTGTFLQVFGGTLRTDFHLGVSRGASGRSAFTLGLALDVGATVAGQFTGGDFVPGPQFSSPGIAGGLYVTLGYAHY